MTDVVERPLSNGARQALRKALHKAGLRGVVAPASPGLELQDYLLASLWADGFKVVPIRAPETGK